MMTLLQNRFARMIAYCFFATLCFIFSLVLTFPDERLKQILIVQIEKNLDYVYDVEIKDLDLWRLSGIELHEVTLKERWSLDQITAANKDAAEGRPTKSQFSVTIPRIAGRFAPWTSLFQMGLGTVIEIDFHDGGMIAGTFVQKSTKRLVHVDVLDLDLLRAGVIQRMTGIPGFGTLVGTLDLELATGKRLEVLGGGIDLKGKKLTIGPGLLKTDKIPSMIYIEVPQTNIGNMALKAKIEPPKSPRAAKLVFETLDTKGRDMRMEMWGDIQLSKILKHSKSNLKLRMQLDETFVKENSLAPLLNIKQFRSGKNGDWFGFVFSGLISKIKFAGSAQSARGPSQKKAKPAKAKPAKAKKK